MVNKLKITKIKYYDLGVHKNEKFLGRCSVVIEDTLMLNGILILSGNDGDYVVMPSKKVKNSRDKNRDGEDIFYPVDRGYFAYMMETILKGFYICKEESKTVYQP